MASTTILVTLLIAALLASLLLWGIFLYLGLQWAKVDGASITRVALVTLLTAGIGLLYRIIDFYVGASSGIRTVPLALVTIVTGFVIPCAVIAGIFKVSFLRAIRAWLPTLIPSVAILIFLGLVVRPFVMETFVSPTNAMAPTLLGYHWRTACAECGKPAFGTPRDPHLQEQIEPLVICEDFHMTRTEVPAQDVHTPDRFLAFKMLSPRRWNLVVFRYPENPSQMYVMRLVGLPGEKIVIRDGAVWADGRRLTPPDHLQGNSYEAETYGWPDYEHMWGTPERPAELRADEYFVLGDFSLQSKDSRFWQQGAPGQSPFAVPKSHLEGVVTHIYWPASRWRALR